MLVRRCSRKKAARNGNQALYDPRHRKKKSDEYTEKLSLNKNVIDKERITIVHSHHRMATLYAELVAQKSVIRVANAHNTFTDKKKLTQWAYRNTKVIAVGEIVKKNLTDFF